MAASSKKRMCHNCGIIKNGHFRKKMCDACYAYAMRNNGKMRPQYLYVKRQNLICANQYCKKNLADSKRSDRGYCKACAAHWRKYGKLRFSELYRRNLYAPCRICGDRYDVLHKKEGRCRACHIFFRVYGKDREPRHYEKYLYRLEYCKNPNCQKQLTVWEIQSRNGWCDPCLTYYQRQKKMRPRELCLRQIAHIKCECGAEAKHEVPIKILKAERQKTYKDDVLVEILNLCDDCYEWETMDD